MDDPDSRSSSSVARSPDAKRPRASSPPDIVSMKAAGDAKDSVATAKTPVTKPADADRKRPGGQPSKPAVTTTGEDGYLKSSKPGVFFMPWEGPVGIEARHDEIQEIIEEADKYGPGQIIVLQINSPGGLVIEGDKIHETLKDVKKRHRVVAWVKEAISAAAFASLHCDEIYFMQVGAMGSAVMFAGQTAISGDELNAWLEKFSEVAEIGGRDPIIARCMVTRTAMASYDKDSETGKVTILSGHAGRVRHLRRQERSHAQRRQRDGLRVRGRRRQHHRRTRGSPGPSGMA